MKILLILLVLPILCLAERRGHGAHVHGSAQLSIAFDGAEGTMELSSPAESILGFEHPATSKKDKKIESEKLSQLESKISDMVIFDAKLKCLITKESMKVKHEGSHGDVDADFKIHCAVSPVGSTITFQLQKYFPALKQVDVTLLAGTLQKSAKIKENGFQLGLN